MKPTKVRAGFIPDQFPPEDITWMGQRVGDMDRETLIKFIGQLDWQISALARTELGKRREASACDAQPIDPARGDANS